MAINWDEVRKKANVKGKQAEGYIGSIQSQASDVVRTLPKNDIQTKRVLPTTQSSWGSVLGDYNQPITKSLPTVQKRAGQYSQQTLKANPQLDPKGILGEAFDQEETYIDKFKQGNLGGGVANFLGAGITGAQSLYLNALNAGDSLVQGKGLPKFQYNMEYQDYDKAVGERRGGRALGEKISDINPMLGTAFNVAMNVGTDPLELTPLGLANDIKLAKGTSQGTQAYADALKSGKMAQDVLPMKETVSEPRIVNESVQTKKGVTPLGTKTEGVLPRAETNGTIPTKGVDTMKKQIDSTGKELHPSHAEILKDTKVKANDKVIKER